MAIDSPQIAENDYHYQTLDIPLAAFIANDALRQTAQGPTTSGLAYQGFSSKFYSASELKQHFQRIGKCFDAVQLSRGKLSGIFTLTNIGSMCLVEINTNQQLLLNGDRGIDCMSFCFESTGLADQHLMFNKPIAPYSLNGFRQGQRESHFQLTANSTTCIFILSINRFNAFISHCEKEELIERLEVNNALKLTPELHQKFLTQFLNILHNPPTTSIQSRQITHYLYTLFLGALDTKTDSKYLTHAPSPRQRLVREFVDWGFKNSRNNYNLDQISETLFASRRTLIHGTKEALGMGPMEMMKYIRLEQVNWILRSTEVQANKNFKTISEVAQHFGFHSRGHFAKAYQSLFAESPSDTWLKSKHS